MNLGGLHQLKGWRLEKVTENFIRVREKEWSEPIDIEIELDDGDCCGYAQINDTLVFGNLKELPVITNIELHHDDDAAEHELAIIRVFGVHKELAAVECECGSGSGWSYGANVRLVCKKIDLDMVVASY